MIYDDGDHSKDTESIGEGVQGVMGDHGEGKGHCLSWLLPSYADTGDCHVFYEVGVTHVSATGLIDPPEGTLVWIKQTGFEQRCEQLAR